MVYKVAATTIRSPNGVDGPVCECVTVAGYHCVVLSAICSNASIGFGETFTDVPAICVKNLDKLLEEVVGEIKRTGDCFAKGSEIPFLELPLVAVADDTFHTVQEIVGSIKRLLALLSSVVVGGAFRWR